MLDVTKLYEIEDALDDSTDLGPILANWHATEAQEILYRVRTNEIERLNDVAQKTGPFGVDTAGFHARTGSLTTARHSLTNDNQGCRQGLAVAGSGLSTGIASPTTEQHLNTPPVPTDARGLICRAGRRIAGSRRVQLSGGAGSDEPERVTPSHRLKAALGGPSADLVGRRRMFIIGLTTFSADSVCERPWSHDAAQDEPDPDAGARHGGVDAHSRPLRTPASFQHSCPPAHRSAPASSSPRWGRRHCASSSRPASTSHHTSRRRPMRCRRPTDVDRSGARVRAPRRRTTGRPAAPAHRGDHASMRARRGSRRLLRVRRTTGLGTRRPPPIPRRTRRGCCSTRATA